MAKGVYDGYYTVKNILTTMDCRGEIPEIIAVCSKGRSAGKTFSFSDLLLRWRFCDDFPLKDVVSGDKFILLTRRKQDIGSIASGVLKGYMEVKQPGSIVYEKISPTKAFSRVYKETGCGDEKQTEHIGYVIPLAAADKIKLVSSEFVDAWCMFFDEFQPSKDSEYLPDEVEALISIHTSVSRGGGEQVRYVPVFMSSNAINVYNPYFISWGLHSKIQSNTRIYRGDGIVFERCMVNGLAEKHAASGFNRAFAGNRILNYADDDSWLNDDKSCIEKPRGWGRAVYVCTLIRGSRQYAVRQYPEMGLLHIDYNVDRFFPTRYNLELDGNLNVPFIKTSPIMDYIRKQFQRGLVRMKDNSIKAMVLDLFV